MLVETLYKPNIMSVMNDPLVLNLYKKQYSMGDIHFEASRPFSYREGDLRKVLVLRQNFPKNIFPFT